jgi:hypothetical protein
MKNLIGYLILIFLASCSQNKIPKDILPKEKMQAVLWDYMRADAFTTDYISKDSTKNLLLENVKLQKEIFNYHHTTKEQFYKSYDYYVNHSDVLTEMLDSIIAQKNRHRPTFFKPLLNKPHEKVN